RSLRLSGFPGWLVWLFVHIAFLNGFGSRVTTLYRWARSMIGRSRPERVFSVGHTGGDLSLPEKVRAKIMPSPFPVMDAQLRPDERATIRGRLGGEPASASEAGGNPAPPER